VTESKHVEQALKPQTERMSREKESKTVDKEKTMEEVGNKSEALKPRVMEISSRECQ
jgi:hypothetical protein